MSTVTPAVPDMSVPDELQKGTILLKVSDKKKKRALFRIDAEQGQIMYESKKSGIIPIESIKEIRAGPEATYYRAQFKLPEEMDNRWITLVYILDGTYKTIHLVPDSVELSNTWQATLRRLLAIRQGLMVGLGNIEVRDAVWEKQYYKKADKSGDSKLSYSEIEKLCKQLSVRLSSSELKAAFKEADTQKHGLLDQDGFRHFVKILKRRPDIEKIYGSLGKVDVATFTKFLHDTQKSSADAAAIFAKYSPNDPCMSLTSFSSFLMSNDNNAFLELNQPTSDDMTRPMSEYFVSSSHNTYLVGHQLVGISTIEGYIRALLHSCRTVEMDIYDGENGEPMVYHGKTLTSAVAVRDLCNAINKYAFVTSPYAIIISAEVHCGLKQQDVLVEIMKSAFGDKLVHTMGGPRLELKQLPSPEDLKGKILVKAKNLIVSAEMAAKLKKDKLSLTVEAGSSSGSESEASVRSTASSIMDSIKGKLSSAKKKEKSFFKKEKEFVKKEENIVIQDLKAEEKMLMGDKEKEKKPLMSSSLENLLVYTVGVKWLGLGDDKIYAPEHVFSLSETSAAKQESLAMVKHTQAHLVRVYPKGSRVNSTNYQPQTYWAMGAQVVAINWQTFDLGYMINQAMFQRNGRCGYILKPEALRPGGEKLLDVKTRHRLDLKIISAQQLPRPQEKKAIILELMEWKTIDPEVHVTLHIPDWLSPSRSTEKEGDYVTKVCASTKAVKNNGFNPVWEESLSFPFDCVGGMMDLIFLEFSVRDHDKLEGDVAKYCVPLGKLGKGYRHLPLHDEQLTQYLFATLFVKVDVVDL